MFQVEADRSKNLLKISYAGHVTPAETKTVAKQVQPLLVDLQPGFRLLTDLSGLESMDLTCVPDIRGMMDLCNKKGVDTVVRVIPDPHKDIGLNILSLFHYRRRVRIATCQTLEEALKALEA
jgi:anti-anti-sigma regulatory factor